MSPSPDHTQGGHIKNHLLREEPQRICGCIFGRLRPQSLRWVWEPREAVWEQGGRGLEARTGSEGAEAGGIFALGGVSSEAQVLGQQWRKALGD